jgi:cell division protein FtsL
MATKKRNTTVRNRVTQPRSAIAWLGLTNAASLQLLTMLALLLVSGLSVVYLTHRDRSLFNELQQLRDTANELDVQWGQLLIERSSLGLGGRVEQRALEDLDMRVPAIEEIIMVRND